MRAEILEQVDGRIGGLLDIAQRRRHLARLDQRLGRRRRRGQQPLGHRPFRQRQSHLLGDLADQRGGPRLVGRLHRDDGVAGLDEQFEKHR